MRSAPMRTLCLLTLLTWSLSRQTGLSQKTAEPVKPVNLEKINTAADETDPYLMADGLNLLYVSNKSGTFQLFQSRRAGATQAWPAGKLLFGVPDADVRTP